MGYNKLFRRGNDYNTTYFPVGNCIAYILANILGYNYVNVSNCNYRRGHILHSERNPHQDFVLTILMAPVFFLISGIVVLRSQHDLSENGVEPYTWSQCYFYN